MIDQLIENLQSTVFCGQRLKRKRISEIQKIVIGFPNLSLRELGHTICENMRWITPSGEYRIHFCLGILKEMEGMGLFVLPVVQHQKKRIIKKRTLTKKTEEQNLINGSLIDLSPISLQVITSKEQRDNWNEFIERYHYLGYKRPIGSCLRYFIVDRQGNKLGCLLFSFAVNSLPCRDEWIGWETKLRKRHLKFVVNNNRFLIFPWVKVKNLASKVLSLVSKQIGNDWQTQHGYQPVLLETFVDPTQYKGTCYQAANWEYIGETAGIKQTKKVAGKTKKAVYVYPLIPQFKEALFKGAHPLKSGKKQMIKATTQPLVNDSFVQLWQNIISIVSGVADSFDEQWQKRKRVLNTLLIMMFIFRLVFAKNKQGYTATIIELWAQCRTMNIELPQYKPVAQSAFCQARKKLNENIFRTLNTEIIRAYEAKWDEEQWNGHRMFAIDGTKINLPKPLIKFGYKTPSEQSYYPQGLLSVLYQVKSKIPIDFNLVAHLNERKIAKSHLDYLKKDDVVIYDRGYFSYAMLHKHLTRGIQVVFRLPQKSYKVIVDFMESDKIDQIVIIEPSSKRGREILNKYPEIKNISPLKLRLIKYVEDETTYTLGTTLLDTEHYKAEDFSEVYHSRWNIEELYKVSKILIDVEDFHGQSERGVKQELFAHFVLITLCRIFSNQVEDNINVHQNMISEKVKPVKVLTNFKNNLLIFARHMEKLLLKSLNPLKKTVKTIMESMEIAKQKQRPGRKYERVSRKPKKKWMSQKTKHIKKTGEPIQPQVATG